MTDKGGSAREILGRSQSARQRSLQRGSRQVQQTTEPQPNVNAAAKGGGAKRGGTKRITVDLPRAEHKFLRDYAYDHETDGMRVVRALLMELRGDSELSGRVLMRLDELEKDR